MTQSMCALLFPAANTPSVTSTDGRNIVHDRVHAGKESNMSDISKRTAK